MKYRLLQLFIVLLLIAGSIKAQNLIAVQNGGEAEFFILLTDAINDAQNGDTIYIPGYIYSIGNMTIDKELHIVGLGHNPDSTLSSGFTKINGYFNLQNGSSNGSIEGIYLNGDIYFSQGIISGFLIKRSNIQSIVFYTNNTNQYSNNSIVENIIRNSISSSQVLNTDVQNNLISNNIIMFYLQGLDYNNTLKNNIIIGGGNYTLSFLNGCLLENNIILEINGGNGTLNNCTLRNNLSPYPVSNFNQSGTNECYNNLIESLNDIFINYPQINQTYNYAFDFHLQPESLGKNAGTDGTDIGIYGGMFPWKEGSLPPNPHIQYKLIQQSTDQNGNLNVNIKVAAQDH